MTFEESLVAISALAPRKWRLGIDRMRAFVEAAGLTSMLTRPNYIHVAGTNGKGSVTAFTRQMLLDAGVNVGSFFSPYVVDPRERVQIGSELVSKELFVELTESLLAVERGFQYDDAIGISEFEFKTALGFAAWKRAECDWIALEVGLGGRFDATNVVMPKCSVIVSIGLDHMAILGDSVELIAAEKAGIIKPGVPVVVGDVSESVWEVIQGVAQDHDAQTWRFGRDIGLAKVGDRYRVELPNGRSIQFTPGLRGACQPHNAALAIAALEFAGAPYDPDGCERTRLPGRYEEFRFSGRRVIVDGAHNVDSARVLAATLRSEGIGEANFVVGMVAGHDPTSFFEPLTTMAKTIHVVPIDFPRAVAPAELAARLGGSSVIVHSAMPDGLKAAAEEANGAPVIVTGSFYLSGEVIRAITR